MDVSFLQDDTQQPGIESVQSPRAFCTVRHESRNDNDVLGRVCCELSCSGSPSGYHLYNRTRRLPPEARPDPLACFLHIYGVLQPVYASNQSLLPFWEQNHLREQVLCGRKLE